SPFGLGAVLGSAITQKELPIPGTPMQRPSSFLQRSVFLLAGSLLPGLVLAAPLPNAWQIRDTSSAGGTTLTYSTNLTASQHQFASSWPGALGGRHLEWTG